MDNDDALFEEILAPKGQSLGPKLVDAYILSPVAPKRCRGILQKLAELYPIKDLTHLKRVRTTTNKDLPVLSIVVGTVDSVNDSTLKQDLVEDIIGSDAVWSIVSVPARPPASPEELNELNAMWPTRPVPSKHQAPPALHNEFSVAKFQQGLRWALTHGGAVVVDDDSGSPHLVATAAQERTAQQLPLGNANPLVTPILLAIQGVSRIERSRLLSQKHETASSSNRYLLTGYDVYTVAEPNVMEAMALLHSRVRKVVCGCASSNGILRQYYIHSLRHTNHRYRAFTCREGTELWSECQQTVLVSSRVLGRP